jgi:hypothetical protein
MAVVAAAAFSTFTAVAHADVMSAGTWDGNITGGTLSIGDGDLQSIAVPAGDPFVVTIPANASAPVQFRAPATHIAIPALTATDGPNTWTAAGSVDVSPLDGTVDPATGNIVATASAHGLLRLDISNTGGTTSLYCQLGDTPTPAPPSPFALNLGGTATAGLATLTDSTFALQLNCGAPFITPDLVLAIIGHPVMPTGTNTLALTVKFTRRADPTPPAATTTKKPPVTTTTTTPKPVQVQCVVPKLTGLKLKKARTAVKRANCAVGTVKRKKSAKKRTTVLKQGAVAGSVLSKGTKIKLTVAK